MHCMAVQAAGLDSQDRWPAAAAGQRFRFLLWPARWTDSES